MGKTWAYARMGLYADTIKSTYSLYGEDAVSYRREVAESAQAYLSDIMNGSYSFDITDDEKAQVEGMVLSYQKDMTATLRKLIEQQRANDTKESGDMHLTISSSDSSIAVNIDRYHVIQSTNMENVEMSMRMSVRMSGEDGNLTAMIDGKVMVLGDDLYITLQDYSLTTTMDDTMIANFRKMLDTIK